MAGQILFWLVGMIKLKPKKLHPASQFEKYLVNFYSKCKTMHFFNLKHSLSS
jgi:hypothetical protein